MPRDLRLYLDDILEAIQQIRTYMADQDEEAFAADRTTQDAVIRNLEIIGEAAGNLPEQFQKTAPEIDWRKIRGLRNILIHEYFGINLPIIGTWFKTSWVHLKQPVENLQKRPPSQTTKRKYSMASVCFVAG